MTTSNATTINKILKGRFRMYTEVASKQAKFAGYVKPIIKDLDVVGKEDRDDNLFQKIWEGFVGVVGEVFENQPKDQIATKIPFEGRLDNPDTDLWITIINILENAFIRAIQPSIDNEISIGSVDAKVKEKETFLEKVFGGDEEDKTEKEAKEEKRKDKKEKRRERREERKQKRKQGD